MSVQVMLHVVDNGVTEDDVIALASGTLGSKYFSWAGAGRMNAEGGLDHTLKIAKDAPGVVVGDRSAFDDPDEITEVMEIIGEDFPVIDADLSERVCRPLVQAGNDKTAIEVLKFLREHEGKKAFVVAW